MAMTNETENRDPERLTAALWLVVRRYCRQARRRPVIAIPALLLPGLGEIFSFYVPPLIIARVLGTFARDAIPTARELIPYVLAFAGAWFARKLRCAKGQRGHPGGYKFSAGNWMHS